MEKRRLFIGFLPHNILSDELENRFKEFGSVSDVLIKQKFNDDGSIFKTFAYMNIETNPPLFQKCLTKYHNAKWKGHRLQVEEALEDYPADGRFSRETGAASSNKMNAMGAKRDSSQASTDPASEKPRDPKSSTRSSKACHDSTNKNIGIEKSKESLHRKNEKRPRVKGLIYSPTERIVSKDNRAVSHETKYVKTEKETINPTGNSKLVKHRKKRFRLKNEAGNVCKEACDTHFPPNMPEKAFERMKTEKLSKRSHNVCTFSTSLENGPVINELPKSEKRAELLEGEMASSECNIGAQNKRNLDTYNEERKENKKLKRSKEDMDKKRLQTLREKQQLAKKMKVTINASLKNVDAKPSNTRIVFDSDSDSGEEASKHIPKKKQTDLFETCLETDSDDGDDDRDRFRVRKQFEGATGHKRFALQTKVDDERFKMNEQFLDELEEENDNREQNKSSNDFNREDTHEESKDIQEEKQKYLEILQEVVRGKPQAPRKDVKLKVSSFTRFDPESEEHSKAFEIKSGQNESENSANHREVETKENKVKRDKTAKIDKIEAESEARKASDEKFYEISTDLKAIFNQGKEFSLTSAFGISANVNERSSVSSDEEDIEGNRGEMRKQIPNFGNLEDDDDSADSDEEHEPSSKLSANESKKHQSLSAPVSSKTFFFCAGDPRFSEGASFMASEDERKKVEAEWALERKRLSRIFKERAKRAARRSRKLQEQNRKRHSGIRKKMRNSMQQYKI